MITRRKVPALLAGLVVALLVPGLAGATTLDALRAQLDAAGPLVAVPVPDSQFRCLSEEEVRAIHPGQPLGVTGCRAVIDAWDGLAWAPDGTTAIAHGGGHNDYSGNEVYRWTLAEGWVLVQPPAPITDCVTRAEVVEGGPRAGTCYWAFGAPSPHSWGLLTYDAAGQWVGLYGAAGPFKHGGAGREGMILDLAKACTPAEWAAHVTSLPVARICGEGAAPAQAVRTFERPPRGVTRYSIGQALSLGDDYVAVNKGKIFIYRHATLVETVPSPVPTGGRDGYGIFHVPDGFMVISGGLGKTATKSYWARIKWVDGHAFVAARGTVNHRAPRDAWRYDETTGRVIRRLPRDGWVLAADLSAFADASHVEMARLGQIEGHPPVASGPYDRAHRIPALDSEAGAAFIEMPSARAGMVVYRVPPGYPEPPIPEPFALQKALDAGGTVVIPPGVHTQCGIVRTPTVIHAEGAHLKGAACGGKGALIVRADVTITGLECSGISVGSRNGACVRQEQGDVTLEGVYFHDSDQGVLGSSGTLIVRNSRFERLGRGGRAHSIYMSSAGVKRVEVSKSVFSEPTGDGHFVKSWADETVLDSNTFDCRTGNGSRLLDASVGGTIVVTGNAVHWSLKCNSEHIGYAPESGEKRRPDGKVIVKPRKPGEIIVRDNLVDGDRGRRLRVHTWP